MVWSKILSHWCTSKVKQICPSPLKLTYDMRYEVLFLQQQYYCFCCFWQVNLVGKETVLLGTVWKIVIILDDFYWFTCSHSGKWSIVWCVFVCVYVCRCLVSTCCVIYTLLTLSVLVSVPVNGTWIWSHPTTWWVGCLRMICRGRHKGRDKEIVRKTLSQFTVSKMSGTLNLPHRQLFISAY